MKNSFLNNLITFILHCHSIVMSQPTIHIPNTVTSTREDQNKPRSTQTITITFVRPSQEPTATPVVADSAASWPQA